MMICNTPSTDQNNEAVELSFFSMDIQFSSRLSLICDAWVSVDPIPQSEITILCILRDTMF